VVGEYASGWGGGGGGLRGAQGVFLKKLKMIECKLLQNLPFLSVLRQYFANLHDHLIGLIS